MKTPKISTILEESAENFLWDGRGYKPLWIDENEQAESCCAVSIALVKRGFSGLAYQKFERNEKDEFSLSVGDFLNSLGVPIGSLRALPAKWSNEKRQGTRYAWLKLAAQIAREQGK